MTNDFPLPPPLLPPLTSNQAPNSNSGVFTAQGTSTAQPMPHLANAFDIDDQNYLNHVRAETATEENPAEPQGTTEAGYLKYIEEEKLNFQPFTNDGLLKSAEGPSIDPMNMSYRISKELDSIPPSTPQEYINKGGSLSDYQKITKSKNAQWSTQTQRRHDDLILKKNNQDINNLQHNPTSISQTTQDSKFLSSNSLHTIIKQPNNNLPKEPGS